MADDDFSVEQQFDRIVDGCAANVEVVVFQLFPYRVEHEKVFCTAYQGKYGVAFCRMSEFFVFQIFGKQFREAVVNFVYTVHFSIEILFCKEQRYIFFFEDLVVCR
jgi:hypothetical protein